MRRIRNWAMKGAAFALALIAWAGVRSLEAQESMPIQVASPDGRTVVSVAVQGGGLIYTVDRDGGALMLPSRLGFEFASAPDLWDGLEIVGQTRRSVDETWEQPWGELREVRDHHNELSVMVMESRGLERTFTVIFRVFDDGLGFRYHFPEQPNLQEFRIQEELTQFAFADNARSWWIPSTWERFDRSEMLYSQSPLSVVDSVQTPITLETRDGETFMVLHEAHLENYPRMFLSGRALEDRALQAALAPMADGVKAFGSTPFSTPWRTLQIADRVEDLSPSVLGLNLNPPSVIEDTDWIEPMTYAGIWWGMHINVNTWESGPLHGATTERAKQYIDFAAEHGLGGVLVEGWNLGWDGGWIDNGEVFDFTQAYPDYDLQEVARYAQERGVDLVMHNETSGGIYNYERQLQEAYDLYESLGIRAIKSGYVADTIPGGHSHYSQEMVRHHRYVLEEAAKRGIMMNVHEPVHDTGERRTYPNMMTREGSRGQEYNAWSGDGGNPPEHETILYFTRLIPGPMDFTPGVLDILRTNPDGSAREEWEARVQTTVAKQLALYVVIYSPMQMAADLAENYEGHPAFQFIKDVAVDWEQSHTLAGRIGDYVVTARQERGSDEWFLGAITDEEARSFEVPLDFLDEGQDYIAEIYADGEGAHWKDNPLALEVTERRVRSDTVLQITLAPGGGQAVRIRPIS